MIAEKKKMFSIKTARFENYIACNILYVYAYILLQYTRINYTGLRSEIRQSETDLSFERGTRHCHSDIIYEYLCPLKCISVYTYNYY